jgi:hypothetical protein
VLRQGEILSCQLTRLGSNYTFVVNVALNGEEAMAIYKPRDGEAPLWDFPNGTLYKREYAAYLLSEILGWYLVPFTIIREGPYGIGSVQQFVEHDPRENYYTLGSDYADQLKVVCCFDLVANSTDRKPNHLITGLDGRLWSIDHGLTFHSDVKIRTVIWDFGGEPIPELLLEKLAELQARLAGPQKSMPHRLVELLDLLLPSEVEALKGRLDWVLTERTFPGLSRPRRRRGG